MPSHTEFPLPGDPTTCAGHVQPEGDPGPSQERGWDDWDDDWESQCGEGQYYGPF